jgi:hypothetical protein
VVAITDQLLKVGGNEGRGLDMVQSYPAGQSPLSKEAQLRDGDLVELCGVSMLLAEVTFNIGCKLRQASLVSYFIKNATATAARI